MEDYNSRTLRNYQYLFKLSESRFKPCIVGIVVVVTAGTIVGHAVVCAVVSAVVST